MNILKMQIRLKQQLRQVASNTLGDLEPDEMDDYLNQAQTLFLDKINDPRNNKLQIGFEQSYQRFSEVGIAPTEQVRLLSILSQDSMVGVLPTFLHTITRIDVSTEKCTKTYRTVTFKRAIVKFKVPHDIIDFSNFSIIVGSSTFVVTGQQNYLNPENTDLFIRQLHNKSVGNVKFYWESTDDLYEPNSLIITTLAGNPAENAVVNFGNNNSISVNFETVSTILSGLSTDGVYRGANLAQQEDVADMLKDPFQTTKYTRPLVEIRGKKVIVYHNDSFIPKLLRICYIPIPKPVSYNLNESCELPERTHEAIVALAAELIQQDMLGKEKESESRT